MLKRSTGKPNFEWYVKTASTAFTNGAPVQLSSGQLIAATATSLKHIGLIQRDVLTTDSDYATAAKVPVDILDDTDLIEADVKAGVTATAAQVGVQCQFYVDGSGNFFVDPTATSHAQFTITEFVSASKVRGKLNSNIAFVNAA